MLKAMKLVYVFSTTLAAAPAQAGIVNGSFETPTVANGSYTDFSGGSTGITGWTVLGTDVNIVSGSFAQNGITFESQNGSQWLDLTGTSSNSKSNGVKQLVSTTIGAQYALSFYVGSTTDGNFFFPATVDLSIDGGARTSYFNPNAPTDHIDWKPFTVNFTAQNSTTDISFFNGSAGSNYNTGLDNVTVSAVPEPSSRVLLLLALGAAVLVIRLRRPPTSVAGNNAL